MQLVVIKKIILLPNETPSTFVCGSLTSQNQPWLLTGYQLAAEIICVCLCFVILQQPSPICLRISVCVSEHVDTIVYNKLLLSSFFIFSSFAFNPPPPNKTQIHSQLTSSLHRFFVIGWFLELEISMAEIVCLLSTSLITACDIIDMLYCY